ncbi:hypothetical protein [Kitasatospora sp. MBT66]|uniref:hypothetical protein n=1 Tax=Kitasatospora sp. MBT66 TaxID=1444769 RepID=UPI0005B7E168|nr:hypothetical protein [Kitasatospora sp. MBT66]
MTTNAQQAGTGWSAFIEFDVTDPDDELHDTLFTLVQAHHGTPTTTDTGHLALVLSVDAVGIVEATSRAVALGTELLARAGHPGRTVTAVEIVTDQERERRNSAG